MKDVTNNKYLLLVILLIVTNDSIINSSDLKIIIQINNNKYNVTLFPKIEKKIIYTCVIN